MEAGETSAFITEGDTLSHWGECQLAGVRRRREIKQGHSKVKNRKQQQFTVYPSTSTILFSDPSSLSTSLSLTPGTHSSVCSFIKQHTAPHTNRQTDRQTHKTDWRTRARPHPPSPLDLLSYPRTLYSFPPSGDSFHLNATSICGAALALLHINPSPRRLSQSPSGKTNDVCIHPTSPLRSPSPRCARGCRRTARHHWIAHAQRQCVDKCNISVNPRRLQANPYLFFFFF